MTKSKKYDIIYIDIWYRKVLVVLMSKTTFILLGVTYYIISVLTIIIILNKINKKEKISIRKKLKN